MKGAYSDVLAFMRAGRQDIGDLTKPAVPPAAVSLGAGANRPGDGHPLLAHHAHELHRMAECWKQSGQGVTALRARLMLEELGETLEAMSRGDVVGTADGLADLVYVVVGAAITFGIDLDAVWAEVQRANLSKMPQCGGCNGTGTMGGGDPELPRFTCERCEGTGRVRLLDENGKVQKPPGWTPPDIAAVIARQQRPQKIGCGQWIKDRTAELLQTDEFKVGDGMFEDSRTQEEAARDRATAEWAEMTYVHLPAQPTADQAARGLSRGNLGACGVEGTTTAHSGIEVTCPKCRAIR